MENGKWKMEEPQPSERQTTASFSILHCSFSISAPPDGETASHPAYHYSDILDLRRFWAHFSLAAQ
jgi:hypothetical protein